MLKYLPPRALTSQQVLALRNRTKKSPIIGQKNVIDITRLNSSLVMHSNTEERMKG